MLKSEKDSTAEMILLQHLEELRKGREWVLVIKKERSCDNKSRKRRDLSWLVSERQKTSWKSQMQISAPNQWTKAGDPCGWTKEKLEEAEEEADPTGRPAVLANLDPWDLSETEPPTRQHIPAHMKHIQQKTPGTQSEKMYLTLQRLGAPGSREIWWDKDGERTSSWRWGWGLGGRGRMCGMWNSWRVDGGNGIWSVKNKLKIKLN